MLKNLFASVLVFSSVLANAQSLKTSKVLTPNKVIHDFGIVNQIDGDVSYVFKVKNVSTKNVLITTVQPECSCTEPKWTDKEIAPTASGEITVGYNASHYPGEFEKKITVYTTADTFELKIIGKVVPKPLSDLEREYPFKVGSLRFQENVVRMNTIYDNEPKTIEVVFYNDSSKALYKQHFDQVPAYLHVKMPDTIPAKSVSKMTVSFNPLVYKDYGHTIDYISLKVGKNKTEFSVSGNVTPYIPNYTPAQLSQAPRMLIDSINTVDLGEIKSDSVYTQRIKIQNTGKTDLKIMKVKPACTCITSDLSSMVTISPGQSKTMTLAFDTKGREGKTKKNIYIYSNDPSNPAYVFKLLADVQVVGE
jgi:hypothetical protein